MATPAKRNRSKEKQFPLFESEKELTSFLEQSFTESIKQLVRVLVTTMVKEEMTQVRTELGKAVSFNGYYDRVMRSSMGKIENVPIPRFREGFGGWQPRSLEVFEDEEEKVMSLVREMHLLGVSQRKIKLIMQKCYGIKVPASRVGKVYQELAHRGEGNINKQALQDEYEYLYLDGIWQKTKGYGWEENKAVLLCALGVKADGTRKIIGFSFAREESIEAWSGLIEQIKTRGVQGKPLQLIICDDQQGIQGAIKQYYPRIPVQLCIMHKMRNVLHKTRHKHKREVANDLKTIFAQETKKDVIIQAKAVCKKWYIKEEGAMKSLRYNLESCCTYLSFPKDQWKSIRTTNLLEREFREVRRRIKVFDNTFQSEQSALGYANSIFAYLNDHYPARLHTKS